MNLNPTTFARETPDDYDPLFGQKQPIKEDAEKRLNDDAYLVFMSGPGARVLQDLIATYLAKPTMNPALGLLDGTANGWVREGQNSVVRHIIKRMEDVMRAREGA